MMTLKERFDSKWTPEPFSGCRLWIAGLADKFGYGVFKLGGRAIRAHRAAWVLNRGEIPDGLCVLHHCDTPSCVNPDHLFIGTKSDNSLDCVAKARLPSAERNHNTKLTTEQILQIRASHEPWSKLAATFGVHKGTIQGIKEHRHWRHIKSDVATVVYPWGRRKTLERKIDP